MKVCFEEYLTRFRERLAHLFHEENNIDKLSLQRGLPDAVWAGIMDIKPLSVAVPEEYGGRGVEVKECLGMLSAASYESLPLSLTFGINIALFLEPLAKYGHRNIQSAIFEDFLENGAMGGLMITEPDHGSDALNMQTAFTEHESGIRIEGLKHWQGLTGMANYWLIAARNKVGEGTLGRDIEFFVSDESEPGQKIHVEELYPNLGLYMIPYGRNRIRIEVPNDHKLQHSGTGIKMMLDILHRSRMQFPGMGMGFIKRMLDEATEQCNQRLVAGRKLADLDAVQYQLSRLQFAFSMCSGMCARSSSISGIDQDLFSQGLEANAMKALVTDLMQESAQICVQLHGARGYRLNHVAGRGIVDSRPFRIFEGSNEMLYTQMAEAAMKIMKKNRESNFLAFLQGLDLTMRVAPMYRDYLNFSLEENLSQRQMVALGKIMANLIGLQYVNNMVDKGFRRELFDNSRSHTELDIGRLLSEYSSGNNAGTVADYAEDSDWMKFA